jgi:hypothetical protein
LHSCTDQSKKKEDVAGRKEVKEENVGSGNSSTESVHSGYGSDYQIYIPLGWTPW